jgi:hypothetical protein
VAVKMNVMVFWAMVSCNLVDRYHFFEETFCLSSAWKAYPEDGSRFSEISIPIYQII